MVSNYEAVMVTVRAPSGTKSLLPLVLEEGAGRYAAVLQCSEVGHLQRSGKDSCNQAKAHPMAE